MVNESTQVYFSLKNSIIRTKYCIEFIIKKKSKGCLYTQRPSFSAKQR
jgi:hypothetical protein